MAYQPETSITSASDLINRIAVFAAANGWTVDRNNAFGVTLHKAGVTDYIHLYASDVDAVRMRLSIGYDAGLPASSQPNVSGESKTSLFGGAPPKAFLFASGDMVWVACAIARSGEYRHFTFGRLDKAGVYTGGTYIDGTNWGVNNYFGEFGNFNHIPLQGVYYADGTANGYVHADIPDDDRANWIHLIGAHESSPSVAYSVAGEKGASPEAFMVSDADRNAFSGRSILHAMPMHVKRTGSSLYYSLLGVVQDVRYCSINKFEPEQEIAIGTDTWKVFPVIAKRPRFSTAGDLPGASGEYAYAIKKVA